MGYRLEFSRRKPLWVLEFSVFSASHHLNVAQFCMGINGFNSAWGVSFLRVRLQTVLENQAPCF